MYGQKLPDGLIRSGAPYLLSSEDDQPIPMDDIIKLWRAHFVMKSAQPSETSSRLEYFFWRIMGNPRLRQVLRESQIARFHAIISKDVPIRTTPRQSPVRTDLRKNTHTTYTTNSGFLTDGRLLGNAEKFRADTSAIKASITRDRSTSRPKPILRAPGIDTSHSSKSARILTPTWGSNAKGKLPFKGEVFDARRSSLKVQSSSSSAMPEDGSSDSNLSPLQQESTTPSAICGSPSKSPRRGSAFAVGSKRRRPSMPSKRSSQSSTSTASRSPRPSPTTTQASLDFMQTQHHDQASLSEPISPKTNVPSRNQPTFSIASSASSSQPLESPTHSDHPDQTDSSSRPPPRKPSISLNPHMRAIATKSTMSTGLSTTSPIVASLQPFTEQGSTSQLSIRTPAVSRNHLSSGTQSDIDVLNRSRENLNQLLERDRRRSSVQKKSKRSS